MQVRINARCCMIVVSICVCTIVKRWSTPRLPSGSRTWDNAGPGGMCSNVFVTETGHETGYTHCAGYQCRRKKSRRIPKICPVPGCRSKPQKKRSQHLKYKHPYLDDEKECSHYLKRAMKVLQRPLKRPPGQPTLHE